MSDAATYGLIMFTYGLIMCGAIVAMFVWTPRRRQFLSGMGIMLTLVVVALICAGVLVLGVR